MSAATSALAGQRSQLQGLALCDWPLPAGHRQRLEIYNLYHLLNHANLFGGGYWSQAERSIAALLRQWG